eukprot:598471-Karenia_brevis.AAC.1
MEDTLIPIVEIVQTAMQRGNEWKPVVPMEELNLYHPWKHLTEAGSTPGIPTNIQNWAELEAGMPDDWTTKWVTKYGALNFAGFTKNHWWYMEHLMNPIRLEAFQNTMEVYMKTVEKCRTSTCNAQDQARLRYLRLA